MSRRVSRRSVDDGPTTVRSARQVRSWTRMPGLTLRSRVGALFATEPQWPRINRSWAAVWERVIRASSVNQRPHRADYGKAARVTTPLRLLVTRAASRRRRPGARRSPVTGPASMASGVPSARAHLPTGAHRHRARRGPALGDASVGPRLAVDRVLIEPAQGPAVAGPCD